MEFDHKDPATKRSSKHIISTMISGAWARVMEELPLLQMLCRNCHRIKTLENGDYKFRRGESNVYQHYPPKPKEVTCSCGIVIVTVTNAKTCGTCLKKRKRASDRKRHTPKDYAEKTCVGCPTTFKPRLLARIWCSQPCRWKNRKRVNKSA
jgi:hypothetical protein